MTIRELRNNFVERLGSVYGEREAKAVFMLVAEVRLGVAREKCLVEPDFRPDNWEAAIEVLDKLAGGMPVQYVLGSAHFCGMDFEVAPGVLIPRPETGELVELIARDQAGKRIALLDIGTGSGAIAVALAAMLPDAVISAVDVSPEALRIAGRNALNAGVDVRFAQVDILNYRPFCGERFDVVVSNPPYVPLSDKGSMSGHVVGHEPHIALFVDDEDPLIFYRVIARYAHEALSDNGTLYFEIYEKYGDEMTALLYDLGFRQVEVLKDINSKDRIVRCRKG